MKQQTIKDELKKCIVYMIEGRYTTEDLPYIKQSLEIMLTAVNNRLKERKEKNVTN